MPSSQPHPLRVLLIAPSLRITGGQSVQAARLLDELRRIPALDVAFQPINPRLPGPLAALQKIRYVRTVLTEAVYCLALLARVWRYDVLHVFSAGYSSFALVAAPAVAIGRMFGRQTILHYHDGQAEDHFQKWPSAIRIVSWADRIVVPSRFLVEVFGKRGLRASYIFNSVDTSVFRFRRRDRPQPRFFHNRGMETHYNIPCTIEAFAIVQRKYPDASLRLAHDGPMRPQLEKLVRSLNLENVEFLGFVDQERTRQLYDEADIYLTSPNIDNMPLSILECFACGLPFVSTAAGGVPFIVDNDRTGLLVPINDHVAMATAALRLLEETGLAARLAAAGLAECDRYRGPALAREWADLYRQLAG